MVSKKTAFILFAGFLFGSPAFAQTNTSPPVSTPSNVMPGDGHSVPHGRDYNDPKIQGMRGEVSQDRSVVKQDEQVESQERQELRKDRHDKNWAGAKQERQELRGEELKESQDRQKLRAERHQLRDQAHQDRDEQIAKRKMLHQEHQQYRKEEASEHHHERNHPQQIPVGGAPSGTPPVAGTPPVGGAAPDSTTH